MLGRSQCRVIREVASKPDTGSLNSLPGAREKLREGRARRLLNHTCINWPRTLGYVRATSRSAEVEAGAVVQARNE